MNINHLRSKAMVFWLIVGVLLDCTESVHFNNQLEKLYSRGHMWLCSSHDICHTVFLKMMMHFSAVSLLIFLHLCFPSGHVELVHSQAQGLTGHFSGWWKQDMLFT